MAAITSPGRTAAQHQIVASNFVSLSLKHNKRCEKKRVQSDNSHELMASGQAGGERWGAPARDPAIGSRLALTWHQQSRQYLQSDPPDRVPDHAHQAPPTSA